MTRTEAIKNMIQTNKYNIECSEEVLSNYKKDLERQMEHVDINWYAIAKIANEALKERDKMIELKEETQMFERLLNLE